MLMKGITRREDMGIAGRRESVKEAMKKGFSASGRKTAKLEVVGPVGTKLKRARCFGISFMVAISQGGYWNGESAHNLLQFLRPFQILCRELT